MSNLEGLKKIEFVYRLGRDLWSANRWLAVQHLLLAFVESISRSVQTSVDACLITECIKGLQNSLPNRRWFGLLVILKLAAIYLQYGLLVLGEKVDRNFVSSAEKALRIKLLDSFLKLEYAEKIKHSTRATFEQVMSS
jgi:ABC-type transport system involved in cytochrome bd biosynthesis fused ATPase/permease subunit